jgi:uncharacterized protein YdaU (DUF1376 family)
VDNNWFKLSPSKLLAVTSSLPTGQMRAHMMLLTAVYLNEGGLPDDDEAIAFRTALPVADIQALRPYFRFLGRCDGGRLYLNFAEEIIMERVEFAEKKAKAANQRWANEQNAAEQIEPDTSKAKQNKPVKCAAKQRNATHSGAMPNKQTNKQTNNNPDDSNESSGADALTGLPPTEQQASKKPDPLFDAFCQMFAETHDGEPYAYKQADFVKLAEMRKRYAKAKPQPWEVTPERFKQAATNYFGSDLATHTLADLCNRFSTFYRSALDRFNKPVTPTITAPSGAETATHYADGREKPTHMQGFVC